MKIDTEKTLKNSALELEEMKLPRSEHHLGFLIQVHLSERVTWGEVSADQPSTWRNPDPQSALDLASMVDIESDIVAIGFTYTFGSPTATTVLYRMTPVYLCRERYRHGEWSPAIKIDERNAVGIELLLLMVHKLLKGRVVNDPS
jgi:hypothetical protein